MIAVQQRHRDVIRVLAALAVARRRRHVNQNATIQWQRANGGRFQLELLLEQACRDLAAVNDAIVPRVYIEISEELSWGQLGIDDIRVIPP